MINVVYLVLVLKFPYIDSVSSVSVPQATMAQCQTNAKHYKNERAVISAYCIVGVK